MLNTCRYRYLITVLLVCIGTLTSAMAFGSQADLDREIDQLLDDFTTREVPVEKLAAQIKWSGISDARLFDPIEARLLEKTDEITRLNVQYLSWLVQILAFSGQPKYFDTLQQVSIKTYENKVARKLAHYTKSALNVFPDFKRWNPIIYKDLDKVPVDRIAIQRIINMLESEDPTLVPVGVDIVLGSYAWSHNPEIFEVANRQLLLRHDKVVEDGDNAEAVANLCKLLGESNDPNYLPTLDAVNDKAQFRGIGRWADKSAHRLRAATR